jgi:hypothetical protein
METAGRICWSLTSIASFSIYRNQHDETFRYCFHSGSRAGHAAAERLLEGFDYNNDGPDRFRHPVTPTTWWKVTRRE